jgi:hypothetical protein
VTVLTAADRLRSSPRTRELLLYAAAAGVGLLAGYSFMADGRLMKLLLLLAGAVLAMSISPEKVFIGWLFCAPFVQGASAGPHHGHAFYEYLFLTPPLIILARMALGDVRIRRLWIVDALPAVYVAYILVRIHLYPTELTGTEASLRGVYTGVGMSVLAYYFIAFGKTSDRFPTAVAGALLLAATPVAIFALVDAATGWNLWNTTIGGAGEVRRVSATFSGPLPLGAYLGAAVAFAVAILVWNGPRALRTPALLLILVAVPALYFTYTRGPVLAIAAVSAAMALLANRARWPSVLLFLTVGLLVAATWNHLSSTGIYQERIGVTSTVTSRRAIQDESVQLWSQKPLLGWGYNTFDEARLTLPSRDPQVQALTSHDTYLTVLVELGVVGLALLVVPWGLIAFRALRAAARREVEPWIVGACIGAAMSFWLGALTYDARFFSFSSAIPWIVIGLARRALADLEQTNPQSALGRLSAPPVTQP